MLVLFCRSTAKVVGVTLLMFCFTGGCRFEDPTYVGPFGLEYTPRRANYSFGFACLDNVMIEQADIYVVKGGRDVLVAFAGHLCGGGAECSTNATPVRVPDDVAVAWRVGVGPVQRQTVHFGGLVADPDHFQDGVAWVVFNRGRWTAHPVSVEQTEDALRHGKSGYPWDDMGTGTTKP